MDHQNRDTALILESHHRMILEARQSHALISERLDRQTIAIQQYCVREITTTDDKFSYPDAVGQHSRPENERVRHMLDSDEGEQQVVRATRWTSGSRQSLRVRLAPWFTTRVWEISLNLTINMRTSNLVPYDSIIFDACRGGDIMEVLALFQAGEASPFDYSHDPQHWAGGMTVLGVSSVR